MVLSIQANYTFYSLCWQTALSVCVLLEHKGGFNVSINISAFSGNSEQSSGNNSQTSNKILSTTT